MPFVNTEILAPVTVIYIGYIIIHETERREFDWIVFV